MTFAFEFRSYRTPFKRPLLTAHGPWLEREGIIIRITDESGRTALGEIAPVPWFGTETLAQALDLCRSLGPKIQDGWIEEINETLPCCRFAFGSAMETLSGRSSPDPFRRCEVACLLPARFEAIAAAERAAARGFTRLKWKVGVDDEDSEIAVLRKLANVLPTGVLLRLDANGAWDRGTARTWIDACDGMPVEFIEQPFPRGDDAALLEIGTAYPWLIALDESVTPPGELWRWLEAGWPGVVVVKPSLAGDPAQLRKLLTDSKADVVFSTALETTIGWHAALQFALGHAGARRALGFGAGNILVDNLLNPPEATPIASAKLLASTPDTWTHLAH